VRQRGKEKVWGKKVTSEEQHALIVEKEGQGEVGHQDRATRKKKDAMLLMAKVER